MGPHGCSMGSHGRRMGAPTTARCPAARGTLHGQAARCTPRHPDTPPRPHPSTPPPLCAAGATGGFAAGEVGLKQFVQDGELKLRKEGGPGVTQSSPVTFLGWLLLGGVGGGLLLNSVGDLATSIIQAAIVDVSAPGDGAGGGGGGVRAVQRFPHSSQIRSRAGLQPGSDADKRCSAARAPTPRPRGRRLAPQAQCPRDSLQLCSSTLPPAPALSNHPSPSPSPPQAPQFDESTKTLLLGGTAAISFVTLVLAGRETMGLLDNKEGRTASKLAAIGGAYLAAFIGARAILEL